MQDEQKFPVVLKLAREAYFQHRFYTALQLYNLAKETKPALSNSIDSYIKAMPPLRNIGACLLPRFSFVIVDGDVETANSLLKIADNVSLSCSVALLNKKGGSYSFNLDMNKQSDKRISVEEYDNEVELNIDYWLRFGSKMSERDTVPIFLNSSEILEFTEIEIISAVALELYSPGKSLHWQRYYSGDKKLASDLPKINLVFSITESAENTLAFHDLLSTIESYNISIHFIVSSPGLLFSNEDLLSLLRLDVVDRVQISDRADFFITDFKEYIRKISDENIIVSSLHTLEFVFHIICKLIFSGGDVSSNYSDLYYSFSIENELKSRNIDFSDFLKFNHQELRESEFKYGFITESAITRLGGIKSFRESRLSYCGTPFSEISTWWIPHDNRQGRIDKYVYFPDEVVSKSGTSLVFDIQPAVGSESSPFRYLPIHFCNVRRRLLTAKRVKSSIQKVEDKLDAVFLMSCFNKAQFVKESIFGVILQSYANSMLVFYDDGSTDGSLNEARSLISLLTKRSGFKVIEGAGKEGTYRIRNRVISDLQGSDAVYLVNDADDFSTARRAEIQLSQLAIAGWSYLFSDIVRVDTSGHVLSVNGNVERYGTASFAAKARLHEEYGYFENLKKGADTEFIERMERFAPKGTGGWWRYPVLFQTFNNCNLTSDIYTLTDSGAIEEDISARSPYIKSFRKRHKKITRQQLAEVFTYNNNQFPGSYLNELQDFFMPEQSPELMPEPNVCFRLSAAEIAAGDWKSTNPELRVTETQQKVEIRSHLAADQHAYLMANYTFSEQQFAELSQSGVSVFFDAEGDLGISAVLIFFDNQGEKISHQFFWVNEVMPVKMPAQCSGVQLGFRIQGGGTILVTQLEIGLF